MQTIASTKSPGDRLPRVYDRALLLYGSKRNEVLNLAEIEQYGADSFGDADYVSIYGMRPREWYSRGIRLLGRTAVECTGDALGKRIALDVVSVAARMPLNQFVVIDAFAGSCNTLFWILRHLPNSQGIAFESDPQVFELTHRTVRALDQRIDLVQGDYVKRLAKCRVPEDPGPRRQATGNSTCGPLLLAVHYRCPVRQSPSDGQLRPKSRRRWIYRSDLDVVTELAKCSCQSPGSMLAQFGIAFYTVMQDLPDDAGQIAPSIHFGG